MDNNSGAKKKSSRVKGDFINIFSPFSPFFMISNRNSSHKYINLLLSIIIKFFGENPKKVLENCVIR